MTRGEKGISYQVTQRPERRACAALLGGAVVGVLTLPRLARLALRKRSLRRETKELKQRIVELEQRTGDVQS